MGIHSVVIRVSNGWQVIKSGVIVACNSDTRKVSGYPDVADNGTFPYFIKQHLKNGYFCIGDSQVKPPAPQKSLKCPSPCQFLKDFK